MDLGRTAWAETRATLTRLLSAEDGTLRDNAGLRAQVENIRTTNLLSDHSSI